LVCIILLILHVKTYSSGKKKNIISEPRHNQRSQSSLRDVNSLSCLYLAGLYYNVTNTFNKNFHTFTHLTIIITYIIAVDINHFLCRHFTNVHFINTYNVVANNNYFCILRQVRSLYNNFRRFILYYIMFSNCW